MLYPNFRILVRVTAVMMLTFLIASCSIAQGSNYDSSKKFTPEQLQEDFDFIVQKLEEIHPSLYAFTSEVEFAELAADTKSKLTRDLTELEFQNFSRKFVKNVRCGHTAISPSPAWYQYIKEEQKILPFKIFIHEEKIFIRYSNAADSLLFYGTQITKIDQVEASVMLKEMRELQQIDGFSKGYENKSIERLFQTYHLFLYGVKDSYQIEFINKLGKKEEFKISSNVTENKLVRLASSNATEIKITGSNFYLREELGQAALLDINSFPSRGYRKYYKSVFKKIKKENIDHLIIDLRGNGGGYFPNSTRLLRYLLDEEFSLDFSNTKSKVKTNKNIKLGNIDKLTKSMFNLIPDRNKLDPKRNYSLSFKPKKKHVFDGKIYLIIDGASFSMSAYVATKLKHLTDATIVGQETGGGEIGSNALLWYHIFLPHSKLKLAIPYYFLDHDVQPELIGRGVIPDIPVSYKLTEKLNRVDKEMLTIEKLIQNN